VNTPSHPPIHIVVTCTNRKRARVPRHLQLGSLRERRPGPRFAAWTRRLAAEEPTIAARDLYSGEHWRIATKLPSVVGGSAQLWVCSAGYGLVSVVTALHPYAATFSPGNPDSVGRNVSELRRWWQQLAGWAGPVAAGQPRSVADLAGQNPHGSVVAVMSQPYLRACTDDLLEAAARLTDPDRFAVIGPSESGTDVEALLVPVTARLRPVVGGSLHALHTRAAAYLLSNRAGAPVSREVLQEAARRVIASAPVDASRRAPGVRLSDAAVRAFIRRQVERGGLPSATVLLRRLRDQGMSCEQSRFKRLYDDTVGKGVVV